MEPLQIGVPKIIYETLEDILEAQVRKLALDIGKTLHVDPKLLIKELKKEKIKTYLFEDGTDVNIRCKSYMKEKHLYLPCEHPIILGKDYCPAHLTNHIIPPKEAKELTILYHGTTKYYRDIENIVYDLEGLVFGKYNSKTQVLYKFIVDQ